MIALKARRRVEVGPYLSFVFENRALLPGPRELSATLFIEIAERSRSSTGRDVWFELGGITVPGSFEAGHSDEEKGKLAAVHFVPFAFARPPPFRDSPVDLVVDHPAARARARLSQESRAELLTDLAS